MAVPPEAIFLDLFDRLQCSSKPHRKNSVLGFAPDIGHFQKQDIGWYLQCLRICKVYQRSYTNDQGADTIKKLAV